jgi:hypothetical protein
MKTQCGCLKSKLTETEVKNGEDMSETGEKKDTGTSGRGGGIDKNLQQHEKKNQNEWIRNWLAWTTNKRSVVDKIIASAR